MDIFFTETNGGRNGAALELAEIPVQNQTCSGQEMCGSFSYSWVVKDQIEKLIHQSKNKDKTKGKITYNMGTVCQIVIYTMTLGVIFTSHIFFFAAVLFRLYRFCPVIYTEIVAFD